MKRSSPFNLIKATTGGRLLNFRPWFCIALFLSAGIAFAYLLEVQSLSPWWVFVSLAVALIIVWIYEQKPLTAVLLLLAFAFGLLQCSILLSSFKVKEFSTATYEVRGRVVERALGANEEGEAEVRLDTVTLGGSEAEGLLTLYLPLPLAQNVKVGDTVYFTARVEENTKLFSSYGFRAEAIAEGRRFYATAVKDFAVTGRTFDIFLWLREGITEAVREGMSEGASSVTLAVLLGDTTSMDDELLENVRRGGIAHIFAVSGLHIGTLFGAVAGLLRHKRLRGLRRGLRLAVVAGALLFYGGICGFSASVLRAVLTCLTFYACNLFGRKRDSLEALALAQVCVLCYQPTQLFAVGFQLSFLACYGIAFLSKNLASALRKGVEGVHGFWLAKVKKIPLLPLDPFAKNPRKRSRVLLFLKKTTGFLAVSLSAQVFTFPVLLLKFGEVAELGLLLNLLFVPLVSLLFCPLLVWVLIGCAFHGLSGILLSLPSSAISLLVLVFELIDFRAQALPSLAWSVGAITLYYASLLCWSDKCNLTKKQRIVVFFLLAGSLIASLFA